MKFFPANEKKAFDWGAGRNIRCLPVPVLPCKERTKALAGFLLNKCARILLTISRCAIGCPINCLPRRVSNSTQTTWRRRVKGEEMVLTGHILRHPIVRTAFEKTERMNKIRPADHLEAKNPRTQIAIGLFFSKYIWKEWKQRAKTSTVYPWKGMKRNTTSIQINKNNGEMNLIEIFS